MSYCLNPECPAPGDQKTLNPEQAKFCSNCGAKLLLSDRYRAQQVIGQGGFGKTFLAIDEHKPSRPPCVIKQFHGEQSAEFPEKAAELFKQEAVRLDELGHHPQIPTLYAYFEQDQQQYLVQEFIAGQNLEQELQEKGAFNEVQVRQVLNDLLPVLQYIHARQVIHRDIKPENIIRREGETGASSLEPRRCVLVDFGASKFATDDLIKPGTKIGSRGYTAPEQAEGNATFSSDLYSLGVTCIQLLTGIAPVHLYNAQHHTWTWKQQVKHALGTTLEQVLDKLLQKDAKNRYQSADEVLRDLDMIPPAETQRSPQWDITSVRTIPASSTHLPLSPVADRSKPSWECIRTLIGHDSWVRSVALSPDGQILASGSGDKTVKIWSVETGEVLRTLEGHTSWVRAIAISPDGKNLASASNDKTIRLWEIATGKLRSILTEHTDWVRAAVFSADGQTLLTGSQDKTAILWDVLWDYNLATPLQTLADHTHWVVSVAISPDSQTLATGSRDQTVKLWLRETGKCRYSLTGHSAEVLSVAINPDGRMLASSSADNTVKLWKLSNGKHLHTITGHDSAVNTVVFSPDGKLLATGSNDHTIKLWRVDNGKVLTTLDGHEGWVWSVVFSADSQTLASGSWDGTIKVWRRV